MGDIKITIDRKKYVVLNYTFSSSKAIKFENITKNSHVIFVDVEVKTRFFAPTLIKIRCLVPEENLIEIAYLVKQL